MCVCVTINDVIQIFVNNNIITIIPKLLRYCCHKLVNYTSSTKRFGQCYKL